MTYEPYESYVWLMIEIGVSEARESLADVLDRARQEHEPIYLTRRGRRLAAVIDADDLDRLIALAEDALDMRAVDAARAEMDAGEPTVSLEEIRAELGL